MTPRQLRLLKELSGGGKVYVKDLRKRIGAQNPAQVAFSLRRGGWDIHTGFIAIQDRDGVVCRPGYYWLNDDEKKRALDFLEGVGGAGATAPVTKDSLEQPNSESSENDDNMREGI